MGMIANFKRIPCSELSIVLDNPEKLTNIIFNEDVEANHYDLDKSWHAIHFLLNRAVWEITTPAGELFIGGTPISDEDMGYGPARYFEANKVVEINNELEKISSEMIFSNFQELLEQGSEVYPGFEDSEEDREYIEQYFVGLKAFCKNVAQEKLCLISYMQ